MKDNKYFLVIDTTTDKFLAGLGQGQNLIAEKSIPGRKHADRLMPVIKEILSRAGLGVKDIDVLGVGTGPGSFTGIRVGMSCIITMGQYLSVPVCSFSVLDIMGKSISRPVLKAYRDKYYTARYDKNGIRKSKYSIIRAEEHPDIETVSKKIKVEDVLCRTVEIYKKGKSKSWRSIEPIYIMETEYKPKYS